MNEYIRMRVRADADHMIALAVNEAKIAHPGMRGRFRELLVDTLLAPWLLPYVASGTGMIIDVDNRARNATQEDIVLFDRSLMPSVLASTKAPDGVFPFNGVLARIEVKSRITRLEVRKAVDAAAEIAEMKFAGQEGKTWPRPVSLLFAFDSDLQQSDDPLCELKRLLVLVKEQGLYHSGACPETPGPIHGLCVVGRGCWAFGGVPGDADSWMSAKLRPDLPREEVLLFVGSVSNTCFTIHARRQGRDPKDCVEGGIGNFILSTDVYEKVLI